MADNAIRRDCATATRLARLSLFSAINESSFQLALLVELALVARACPPHEVAAYAAVSATLTFALSIFNFLLTVVFAQVGKAVGAQRWAEVGRRLRVALIAACFLGGACAGLLFALQEPVLDGVLALAPPAHDAARQIFRPRLICLPLMMVQRVCGGALGGYQRVRVLAARAVLVAGVEVLSQYLALEVFDAGLVGATWGRVATAAMGAALSLLCVLCFPPAEARGQIRLCSAGAGDGGGGGGGGDGDCNNNDVDDEDTPAGGSGDEESICSLLRDFARASGDVTVRSLLLTGSVYAMSVTASNLGTAQLTAHQIAMTLWMLMSLICDGFADVGTMLGSKLLGADGASATAQLLTLRDTLMVFGLVCGLGAAAAMQWYRDPILSLFSFRGWSEGNVTGLEAGREEEEKARLLLGGLWPLLAGMQVVNAVVFVLDGFIYAAHEFRFVRNLMLVACVGWFGPALAVGWKIWHTLLLVWVAKAGLNGIRCAGAVWLLFWRLPRDWQRRRGLQGKQRAGKELGEALLSSS